jgi:hypothetical protein
MPFVIKRLSETATSFEVGENLWLKADRETVVHEGDGEAAFLLASAGKRLSMADAERYGLVAKAKVKGGDKQAEPSENKQAQPESAKDLVAHMGEMTDEELEKLAGDERKTVSAAVAAEHERRADGQ